ncbi:MAG: phosphate regulon sensor histidine kinase PhoR [Colwellia sp.]
MYFRLSFRTIIVRLIAILAASAVLGYLLGHTLLVLLISSLSLLIWHYNHLFKLVNWLWQSKTLSPPQADGIWGRVYDGLYRKIQRHRKKYKQQTVQIRRFRDGAEALPDAALMLSQELTIQWGNKKAQKLLGIRWPDDLGQRIDNLLRAPKFAKYLAKASFKSPCSLVSPVNSEIQLEIRLMPYGSDNVLLLARDISTIHRLEQMRKDFVANVSHELKTPLTVVRGYVEMIQETNNGLDSHWKQAFNTIESQVSRMDRLVDQLLNLSKVENNSGGIELKKVNMPQLISGLVADAKWLNQDKQHEIIVNIDANIGLIGTETELKSACANLLSNAIAYTPINGCIEVSWQKSANKMKFSVKDNGNGIKPEHLSRLTERFYRVDKSRSRDTGGSGLGLAIVKHILNHHKAELVINSKWQEGSEFAIYFDESVLYQFV